MCLTAEQEADLARRVVAGDQAAIHRLVEAHMPLAEAMAARYHAHCGRLLGDSEDYRQECYLLLLQAVRRYDHCKGVRLATYAAASIAGGIHAAAARAAAELMRVYNFDFYGDLEAEGRTEFSDQCREAIAVLDVPPGEWVGEVTGTLLDRLTKREREAVERRHGLDGEGWRTISEVAVEMSLSLNRTRNLLAAARKRMCLKKRACKR